MIFRLGTALFLFFLAGNALAYIGPGAGISFLGSFLAAIVAVFAAIFAVLLWPIRYMIRRMKRVRSDGGEAAPEATADRPATSEEN